MNRPYTGSFYKFRGFFTSKLNEKCCSKVILTVIIVYEKFRTNDQQIYDFYRKIQSKDNYFR